MKIMEITNRQFRIAYRPDPKQRDVFAILYIDAPTERVARSMANQQLSTMYIGVKPRIAWVEEVQQ